MFSVSPPSCSQWVRPESFLKPHLLHLCFSLHFLSLSRENHSQTTMPSSVTSSDSFSSLSTSSFACFSATSPSNLQRFLQCVTPRVPSQILPKVFVSFIFYLFLNFYFCFFLLILWVVFKLHSLSLWVDWFSLFPIHRTVRLFVHLCSSIFVFF